MMTRSEFDPEHLSLDESGNPSGCLPEVVEVFREYTELILETHQYIVNYLEVNEPLKVDAPFTSLVSLILNNLIFEHIIKSISKILAVSFFRVPGTGSQIVLAAQAPM